MPIEIRELHIKATVAPANAATSGDLFEFGPPVPDAWTGKGGPPEETARLHPLPGADLPAAWEDASAAARQTHSGGINMALGDVSLRSLGDGLDLFG